MLDLIPSLLKFRRHDGDFLHYLQHCDVISYCSSADGYNKIMYKEILRISRTPNPDLWKKVWL